MTIEIVKQVLNKNKQNILQDMIMIEAMGNCLNHSESRFDKGKIAEHVIATHRENILNGIGRDANLDGQDLEIKSRQFALCDPNKHKNPKTRYHQNSGLSCIPGSITIHNPQDSNPVEITQENINKWCSHAQALVIMDSGNIDSYELQIASFEDIKKLPMQCFSGSSKIDVHLPVSIMETFITNEEIKDYLQGCTEDDMIHAKNKILRLLLQDRCEKLGVSWEDFIESEYKKLHPNSLLHKFLGGWWK
jgi:hypothetical protein